VHAALRLRDGIAPGPAVAVDEERPTRPSAPPARLQDDRLHAARPAPVGPAIALRAGGPAQPGPARRRQRDGPGVAVAVSAAAARGDARGGAWMVPRRGMDAGIAGGAEAPRAGAGVLRTPEHEPIASHGPVGADRRAGEEQRREQREDDAHARPMLAAL